MHGMISYFVRRLLLVPDHLHLLHHLPGLLASCASRRGGRSSRRSLQVQMAMAASEGGGGGVWPILGSGELELPQEAIDQLKKLLQARQADRGGLRDLARRMARRGSRDGRFSGILQGDFGRSYQYSDPVLSRRSPPAFPISIYFGLIGYFSTWLVCVPLGVQQSRYAIARFSTPPARHDRLRRLFHPRFRRRSRCSCCYLPPSFSAPAWDLFPLGGFRSENWDQMWAQGEIWWCIKDQLQPHRRFRSPATS